MKPISLKNILHQLKADLIGKDSYRGVTLTYSWLANQFGHFSLGYVPSLIIYSVLKKFTSIDSLSFWAALVTSTLWLLFELYNFLGPLLANRLSKSKFLFVASSKKYVFRPDWCNVAFDTFTDLCFFWFGAFSASLFLKFSWTIIYILLALLIIVAYPATYWFITKMYLQYARFPTQFRLSQWQGDISEQDKNTVLNFGDKKDKSIGKHLLIFGGRRSGKSLLSVGIGTEFSIRRNPCSYYTGMKIYNLFSLTEDEIREAEGCEVWSWRTASMLIIDDINPGSPISENLISPEQLLKILTTPVTRGTQNQNAEELAKKNVIWVMGNRSNDLNNVKCWKEMLIKIGVDEAKIHSICLGYAVTS
jgi:hypothetical protein